MDSIALVAYILPAYVANSVPVVLGGGRTKIDEGRRWIDGRRLLGEGKTYRGLIAGIACGTLTGAVLAYALPSIFLSGLAFADKLLASFALSVGTMIGDLMGSFVKRRMGLPDGNAAELLDQLSFLPFAVAFAFPFVRPSPADFAVLILITYAAHKAANWLAHQLQLKRVPW